MTKIFPKLICILLMTSGLSVLLGIIIPVQATSTAVEFAEQVADPPSSITANVSLTATQPAPRFGHTLTRVGDSIYLFGGMDAVEQGAATVGPMASVLNDLWEFNFENNQWRELSPAGEAPLPRYDHATTLAGAVQGSQKLFSFGGFDGFIEVRDQWFYDPGSNAWQRILPDNDAPNALAGHSAVTDATGAPILYGGASAGGAYMDTRVWRYNPETNKYWVLKEEYNDTLKRKWHFAATVHIGGKAYMVVYSGVDPAGQIHNDMWLFDFQTRQWTQVWTRPTGLGANTVVSAAAPAGRAQMAGVAYGSRVLLLGGMDENGNELADVWEYDLLTHHWRELDPLPAPRRWAAAAIVEERADQVAVLVFGGISGGEVISDTFIYTWDVPPTYNVYLPLAMR